MIDEFIKGIFLLVLGVSGNFVAETLGCKTQKLLTENMIAKQFVIFMMIYFAIDFGSSSSQSPIQNIGISSIIFILFIMFTKMNIPFTIAAFLLLITVYILNNYIDYFKNKKKHYKLRKELASIKNKLYYVIIIIIFVGFSLYFYKQYQVHNNNWETIKFLFGTNVCDSMK